MTGSTSRVVVVYGAPPGVGGLGEQAATALLSVARGGPSQKTWALGPHSNPRTFSDPSTVTYIPCRDPWYSGLRGQPPLRWYPGLAQWLNDARLGQWARTRTEEIRPTHIYAFTQVALETVIWAREHGIPTVLDNPNGHIDGFSEVYERESQRWCGHAYLGHPVRTMKRRVRREYDLASRIRVSSAWAKRSMLARGVGDTKISVLPQPIDIERFRPPAARRPGDGPLRVCYVGTLDLRKGFVYLLRAIRRVGPKFIRLEVVGGTVDRCTRRLFERESRGIDVVANPGDPLAALHRAELFVMPTLEDGFGFALAEAMATGLPALSTDACGAAEWIREGESGWVVPPANEEALATQLSVALVRRKGLVEMGRASRAEVEHRQAADPIEMLSAWLEADN